MRYVDGGVQAPIPEMGSFWVWELEKPYATELIQVIGARWNGEEWWITTRRWPSVVPSTKLDQTHKNTLMRFCEAVTAVGSVRGRWLRGRPGRALEHLLEL